MSSPGLTGPGSPRPATAEARVILVEDHTLVREGVRVLLESSGFFEVIAETGSGIEALEAVEKGQPDVLVMDLGLPDMNGLELLRRVRRALPDLRVVVLSMHATDDYFLRALREGAVGYVLKDSASTELIAGLRAVLSGEVYLSPVMQKRLLALYLEETEVEDRAMGELAKLSEREREVLGLISHGLTSREIAEQLHVSVNTVQAHRAHIMRKLDIHGRTQLVRHSIELERDDSG